MNNTILTTEVLEHYFTPEQIEASTYYIQSRKLIRLINTQPDKAAIPALFSNLKEHRNTLKHYSNVNFRVAESINSSLTGNTKTDMEVYHQDLIPIAPTPKLAPTPEDPTLSDRLKQLEDSVRAIRELLKLDDLGIKVDESIQLDEV